VKGDQTTMLTAEQACELLDDIDITPWPPMRLQKEKC
jgi:hypothetical protein